MLKMVQVIFHRAPCGQILLQSNPPEMLGNSGKCIFIKIGLKPQVSNIF